MAGTTRAVPRRGRLTLDHAILAVPMAAMDANRHVSPEEAARAHHIIWSTRRFRRRSGEAVDRLVGIVKDRFERDGTAAVLSEVARIVPARLRAPLFAVAVDVMLVDTRLERAERAFLRQLAAALRVRPAQAEAIVKVILTKNSV
jgi:tellurite resistance protein